MYRLQSLPNDVHLFPMFNNKIVTKIKSLNPGDQLAANPPELFSCAGFGDNCRTEVYYDLITLIIFILSNDFCYIDIYIYIIC